MAHHRDYNNDFYDFTLPTFLEGGENPNNNVPVSVNINNENLVIELGEGSYTLDYNLLIHQHNVIIKGQGSTKTIMNVPVNINYADDAILDFLGLYKKKNNGEFDDIRISVSILGLTINASIPSASLAAGTDLVTKETYLIKAYNVDRFVMHDVKILAENIKTTCLDIRRGFNIDIRDCEFKNYNRRWTGGCIWMRGDIENVIIEDNDFYKYGNDEVIGLYGVNNFAGTNDSDEISKKNVEIRYNRFFSQDSNGGENPEAIIAETGDRGTWHGCNERFITVFTNQDGNKEKINGVIVQRPTPCHQTINGFHLCNNEFHINAPASHLFTAAFDKHTTFKDVTVRNNIINYGNWMLEGTESSFKELIDFGLYYDIIYDSSYHEGNYDGFSNEPFLITGNTITCGSNVKNLYQNGNTHYYADHHIIVDIKGTKVIFNDNTVLCTREAYTTDEQFVPHKGIQLFHCGSKGGEIMFSNNHCEGLIALMLFTSGGAPITIGRLWGNGNYLQGNPRITHVNIIESHEIMTNNEIICDYPIFFLEEFANIGTAIFTGNRVYRDLTRATYFTTPFGHIYYTGASGSGNNIQSMKLICCNNIFDNLMRINMYSYIQNSMSVIHKNNYFTDIND